MTIPLDNTFAIPLCENLEPVNIVEGAGEGTILPSAINSFDININSTTSVISERVVLAGSV
ncbi:hypothetical protein [Limnobaculum allomyrinae]|uniref:hypothetical protein n=1 Tax=Limnobaculum allomyrinae TaxID=2791986 RepID=UPI001E55078D|nr:hypothetical protein [Limnobaculum allomyrinae]